MCKYIYIYTYYIIIYIYDYTICMCVYCTYICVRHIHSAYLWIIFCACLKSILPLSHQGNQFWQELGVCIYGHQIIGDKLGNDVFKQWIRGLSQHWGKPNHSSEISVWSDLTIIMGYYGSCAINVNKPGRFLELFRINHW